MLLTAAGMTDPSYKPDVADAVARHGGPAEV
jgi:hypothetical protein